MDIPKEHTLADRIQGLAQELQDMILDFTVAIEPTIVHVTPAYKKPWQLNINRAIRKKVAETYYRGCTFVWRPGDDTYIYARWLQSLPPAHHAMIQKIRLWGYASGNSYDRQFMLQFACTRIRQWCFPIAAIAGNLLSKEVFWTNINSIDELGYRSQTWVQLQTLGEMRKDPYWSVVGSVVHSWKQPPQGYAWERSYWTDS